MIKAKLKPPPDTRANLQGRMLRLHEDTQRNAMGGILIMTGETSSKAPSLPGPSMPPDYEKRLTTALKAVGGQLRDLQQRFDRSPSMSFDRNPKPAPKPKPRAPKRASPDSLPHNSASSVIEGGSSGPLSREEALTSAFTKPKKPSLLDFMQETLDE